MRVGRDGVIVGSKNIVTIVTDRHEKVWAGCRVPFSKGSTAGELSTDNGATPYNPLGERNGTF